MDLPYDVALESELFGSSSEVARKEKRKGRQQQQLASGARGGCTRDNRGYGAKKKYKGNDIDIIR